MYCGLSSDINPDTVRKSSVLVFEQGKNDALIAKEKGLFVSLYPDYGNMRGSVHKYKNKGKHNVDDFKLSDYCHTLKNLSTEFNFNPALAILRYLEFGVNIIPPHPYNAEMILKAMKHYKKCKDIHITKNGIRFEFDQYEIKVYIKTHEDYPDPLLRFEIRAKKMSKLRQLLGIDKSQEIYCTTLADLQNPMIMRLAGNALLKIFDDMLIVDCNAIDISQLKRNDLELFEKGNSPLYWNDKEMSTSKRRDHLKRFNEIVNTHSTSTLKEDIRQLIAEKIEYLIDIPFEKNRTILPNSSNGFIKKTRTILPNKKSKKSHVFTAWITGEIVRLTNDKMLLVNLCFSKHIIYNRVKRKNIIQKIKECAPLLFIYPLRIRPPPVRMK